MMARVSEGFKGLSTDKLGKKCTQCHATVTLVAKTKNVKPQNPHVSPHYQDQLECTNCHHMHEESENFCGQCYDFKFKVP